MKTKIRLALSTLFFSTLWAVAAPLLNNDEGTWSDGYGNMNGVFSQSNLVHDPYSGSISLDGSQTSGNLVTVEIEPPSFYGWETICLDGLYGNPSLVSVDVLDSSTLLPVGGLSGLHPDTSGCIDISSLSAAQDSIRLGITLDRASTSDPSPVISEVTASWDPKSVILVDKIAPVAIQAAETAVYELRVSVNFVEATDLVVWDVLPRGADGTVLYPAGDPESPYPGQNDDPTYQTSLIAGTLWSGPGSTNILGQTIPEGSVYWTYAQVDAGNTQVIFLGLKTKNGTLNGTRLLNQMHAGASNADTVSSVLTTTTITSTPSPNIDKREGPGIFPLDGINYALPGRKATFVIADPRGVAQGNDYATLGRETMYDVVIWDDVTQLLSPTPLIETALGTNGFENISGGGYYDAAYMPPDGSGPIPAIVWTNVSDGVFEPGNGFYETFDVTFTAAAAGESIVNTVGLDSDQTDPIYDSLPITIELNESTDGIYAKGDDLDGNQTAIGNSDDDRALSTISGGSYNYRLATRNGSMIGVRDTVMIDRIQDEVVLVSASTTPAAASGTVFYATTTAFTDDSVPPPFDYTAAPADFDQGGNTYWSSRPPATPSNTTWIAFYFPAVDSSGTMATSSLPKAVYGDFRVQVKPLADPCSADRVDNVGLFHSYNIVHPDGTPVSNGASFPEATDWERTRIEPEVALINIAVGTASVNPPFVATPDQTTYQLTVENVDTPESDVLLGAYVDITWTPLPLNGVQTYPAFAGLTGGIIDFPNSDPANGQMRVLLNDLAPGQAVNIDLNLFVPSGVADQSTFNISAMLNGSDDLCTYSPAVYAPVPVTISSRPIVQVHKSRDLGLILGGGEINYTIDYENIGTAPSYGTWIVDRIPFDTVFLEALADPSNIAEVRVSDNVLDLPPAASPTDRIIAADLASYFTPATHTGGGVWTSPFSTNTVWIAFRIDDPGISPPQLSVLNNGSVSFKVQNNQGGPEAPTGIDSPAGTQMFNEPLTLSGDLIQAIGNEVMTLISPNPGITVQKSSNIEVVPTGGTFEWWIDYFNNSGSPDSLAVLVDELPAGLDYFGARHEWNPVAVANGAPAGTLPVSPVVTLHLDGSRTIELEIAQTLRGGNLQTLEGGRLILDIGVPTNTASQTEFMNTVCASASNMFGTVVACAEDPIEVRNPDLWLRKSANPAQPQSGDTVNYTLVLSNEGFYPADNVSLTDLLPDGVTYVNGSTAVLAPLNYTIGQPLVSGQTLLWNNANGNAIENSDLVPADPGHLEAVSGNILIIYQATVDPGVPSGTSLTNRVATATTTPEDEVYPNETNAVIRVPFPDPTVTKGGVAIATGGETITWEIAYRNLNNQDATNVWLVDSLPDLDGDGDVDVTFLSDSPSGPGPVTSWYHAGPMAPVPVFNPTNAVANATAGWVSSPVGITVHHIAWFIGTLEASSSIYTIGVTTTLTNPEDDIAIVPGSELLNTVEIFTTDFDDDPANNEDDHLIRTPGVDLSLEKSGSIEGAFPGSLPGNELTYTLIWRNSGTVTAYGLKIEDTLPAELSLNAPSDDFNSVVLNAGGAVDVSGNAISGTIPVTRVISGANVTWYLGTTTPTDALYYKKIGFTPDATSTFQIFTTIKSDVPNGVAILNAATVVYDGPDTPHDDEEYLDNNTDDTSTTIWLPDLTVRKVGHDTDTGSFETTEAGGLIEYEIEYNNLGNQAALNSAILDNLPPGTSFHSLGGLPPGGSFSLLNDQTVQINLGTLNAPAGVVGVPEDQCVFAAAVVELADGLNGMSADLATADFFGRTVTGAGDIDGDGILDLATGADGNNTGGADAGAVWVLLMNTNGTVKTAVELADGLNGMSADLAAGDKLGISVTAAGDINGDGIPDLAAGAYQNDDGGADAGAVWVLLMNSDGTVNSAVELADGLNGMSTDLAAGDEFGRSVTPAGDIDGDGTPDLVASAPNNAGDGAVWVLLMNSDGTVKTAVELADGLNGMSTDLAAGDGFGKSITPAGDIDGDGTPDLAVGASKNDDGGADAGAVWVLLMNTNGSVKTSVELADGLNGMSADLAAEDNFGNSIASAGDIDGDGVPDLAAGAYHNDDGVLNAGGVWVLLMNTNGTVKTAVELASGFNGMSSELNPWDAFGSSVTSLGDQDGNGVPDLAVGAYGNDDGADSSGAVWVLLLNADGTAKLATELASGKNGMSSDLAYQDYIGSNIASPGDLDGDGHLDLLINGHLNDAAGGMWVLLMDFGNPCTPGKDHSLLHGDNIVGGQLAVDLPTGSADFSAELASGLNGMSTDLAAGDLWGRSLISAGDIDGDGVLDLAAGAYGNDDGGADAGAVWVLLMNSDGSVKTAVELADGLNGMSADLEAGDWFGHSITPAGDLDGDGTPDLAAGASKNDDGGADAGAVWVLLMNTNGTVKTAVELADGLNGMSADLAAGDGFGFSAAAAGDLDGDGVPDLMSGASGNDNGGADAGAVWVLLMNTNGTVKTAVELADGLNGMSVDLAAGDGFGFSAAAAGDLDGDGVPDLMSGAYGNDDGGADAGAVWVLLMNTNGTVKTAVELADGLNGMSTDLAAGDGLGFSAAAVGDLDGDGTPDLAAGAYQNDDGGADAGAVWVLLMNTNGTVKTAVELADSKNGMGTDLTTGDGFGGSLAAAGDLDGDGVPDLMSGASGNDNGGSDAGAVWVLLMNTNGTVKTAVELADGLNGMSTDLAAGDGFGWSVTVPGDLDGDGTPDLAAGASGNDEGGSDAGAVWMISLSDVDRYYTNGTYRAPVLGSDVQVWNRLISEADVPDGTSLTYTLLDASSNVVLTAEGPIASDGIDLSGLDPTLDYEMVIDFATTDKKLTPQLYSWMMTYLPSGWPTLTMQVRVDDPVPESALPTLVNNVEISTTTPETDYTNNHDDDDINLILADLAVTKRVDKTVAEEGSNLVYTVEWVNNGPFPAIRGVLTDVLPVGLLYTAGTAVPPETSLTGTGVIGDPFILTWDLGTNVAVGASGTNTIPVTVDTGTAGVWLINNTRIGNDRQEITYDNNDDDAQTYIGGAVDLRLEKTGPGLMQLGSTNLWSFTIENAGNVTASNCAAVDTLPPGLAFVSSLPPPAGVVGAAYAGETVSYALGEMDPGDLITIHMQVAVSTNWIYASSLFTNNAVCTTDSVETDITNNNDDHVAPTPALAPARLSGNVWHDDDRDVVWGTGESGIEGVEIILTGMDYLGSPVARTNLTDSAGHYSFTSLDPGIYTVTETQPAGYLSTGATNGTINGISAGTVNGTDEIEAITLNPGEASIENDFGEDLGSIGDRVWIDINNDGIQDVGEPLGVGGVGVRLYDGATNLVAATVTGADGSYLFDSLTGGVYFVEFDPSTLPTGYSLTAQGVGGDPAADSDADPATGRTALITLAAGQDDRTWDAGISLPASLGNRVWLDEDRDGIQDAGEEGIANVMVFASNTTSGVVLTNWTDANGEYRFTHLDAGTYVVTVPDSNLGSGAPLDGMGQTTNAVLPGVDFGNQTQPYSVTLVGGEQNLTADFGYNFNPDDHPLEGALGDRIWLDADGDGAQDPGEAGIGGVDVVLFTDPDGDGVYDTPAATNTTDATGHYIFTNLVAGGYVVQVDTNSLPGGLAQTGDPDEFGTLSTHPDDQTTTPVILAPGDVFLNVDFGYQPDGTDPAIGHAIGDTVWLDLDADGTTNGVVAEPGIPGVTVNLINSNGVIIATDTTDENGIYLFPGLPDGDYTVQVSDLDGILTDLDQTGDPDMVLDGTSSVTLNGADDLDQDFGYTPQGQDPGEGIIGDTIFHDRDSSGVPDDGEGLAGVMVILTDTNGTVLATVETDPNGNYLFGGLDTNGTYVVTVDTGDIPTGLVNTVDPDGGFDSTSTVDLSADPDGIDLDQDFGYQADPAGTVGSIGDLVWLDTNADGTNNNAEVGIEGVTIDLYLDANGNGLVDPGERLIGSTVTTNGGGYLFTDLPADNVSYVVDVTDTEGVLDGHWHSRGTPGADNNSQTDGYGVTLTSTVPDNTTADFGYYTEPASLGNRVWFDVDADGVQDAGESTGMTNVTVYLEINYGSVTTTVATLTDATGHYSFGNLLLDEDTNGAGAGEPTFVLSVGNVSNYNHTVHNPEGVSDLLDADEPLGVMAIAVQGVNDVALGTTPTNELSVASYDFGFTFVPTFVVISAVRSRIEDGVAVISWDVEIEIDTAGYWLERWTDGEWVRVNTELIAAQFFVSGTRTYEQADPDVAPGSVQRYQIVEFDNQGRLLAYGPYDLTLDGGEVSYATWAADIDWADADSDPNADPDGDGLTNVEEYLAGTHPLNANSVLRITQIDLLGDSVLVSWQSETGKVYTVQMSSTLFDTFLPVATRVEATPPVNSEPIPVHPESVEKAFFRVLVDQP